MSMLSRLFKTGERLGLKYTHDKHVEIRVAKYIELKLRAAAKLFQKHLKEEPRSTDFLGCLNEVWPELPPGVRKRKYKMIMVGLKFYVMDSELCNEFPYLCGKAHRIAFYKNYVDTYGEVRHNPDGTFSDMVFFNLKTLDKSTNYQDLQTKLNELIVTVYHECDHIKFRGDFKGAENIELSILYYITPAELRAHSKQLAFIYFTAYPDDSKFNFEKLKEYVYAHFEPTNKNYNLTRYLDLMNNPAKFISKNSSMQEFLKNLLEGKARTTVKDLKKAFTEFMHFTTVFFLLLKQENSKK